MSQPFESQIVLVTGGSTGIGAAVALELATNGATVLITGRNEASLRASAEQHARIAYFVADVSKPVDVASTVAEIRKRYGRLDVLVNNAGVAPPRPLSDSTPEHAREVFDTNVFGLVELTRQALPLLVASKGTIVNVASTVADQPFPNMSIYAASKAAVVALTRSWAQELAAEGVRVNAVSPGPIETPIFGKMGVPQAALDEFAHTVTTLVPQKRFGKATEVASVVAFLASPSASFVTGAQYTVGGGIEA